MRKTRNFRLLQDLLFCHQCLLKCSNKVSGRLWTIMRVRQEAAYCVVCTEHTSTLAGCCTVQREKGTWVMADVKTQTLKIKKDRDEINKSLKNI